MDRSAEFYMKIGGYVVVTVRLRFWSRAVEYGERDDCGVESVLCRAVEMDLELKRGRP